MSSRIEHVNDLSLINPPIGWNNKENFKTKNQEVQYNGNQYKIVTKSVLKFSFWERVWRGLKGVATLITLKYDRKLFWKSTKDSMRFAVKIIREPEAPKTKEVDKPVAKAKSAAPPLQALLPTGVPRNVEKFESAASRWSFLDTVLEDYEKLALGNPKWNSLQASFFLLSELQSIENEIKILENDVKNVCDAYRLKAHPESKQATEEIMGLERKVQQLKEKNSKGLQILRSKIESLPEPVGQASRARGLENMINTCYLNSALQPLLAIKHFKRLIPAEISREPRGTYAQRKKIFDCFIEFINEYEKPETNPSLLGRLVAKLRITIIEARLQEGGFDLIDPSDFDQVVAMMDCGQIFEILFFVMGLGFSLENTRIPLTANGTPVPSEVIVSHENQGVFYLKDKDTVTVLEGNPPRAHLYATNKSIQQIAIENRIPFLNNESLRNYTSFNETNKITLRPQDRPPEILVIRVDHHVVVDEDNTVDFSPLFTNEPNQALYELVGFSQNRNEVHWTSVIREEGGWKLCNDENIISINSSNSQFKLPATYMIYRKKS